MRINIKVLISSLFLTLLIGTYQTSFAEETSINKLSDAQIQQSILIYVNQYRVKHGLSRLKMNPIISREATQHSHDMALHHVPFGHKYFSTRIKRLYRRISNCQGGAENVAFNYKDTQELVRLWIKSPGHRRNIEGNYNQTGIGIARDKNGKMYYTQMFLRVAEATRENPSVIKY